MASMSKRDRQAAIATLRSSLRDWQSDGLHYLPIRREEVIAATNQTAAATMPVNFERGTDMLTTTTPIEGDSIEKITQELDDCQRCKLCAERTNVVIGRGNVDADLMFIGEGPGRDEDRIGKPFVGRAGKLLDKIIVAMGFDPGEVYIANIVKCRPPKNRNPEPDEMATCLPFLMRQIAIVQPKVLCTLGSIATTSLLQTEERISSLRGKFTSFNGLPLMPTYHPAFLLRNPKMKRVVWEDVQKISEKLGRPTVTSQQGSN